MKIETESVVSRVVAGIITIIFAVFLNWICLPAWNIRSGGFWWYLIVVGIFATISFGIADRVAEDNAVISTTIILIIVGVIAIIGVIGAVASSKLANAVKYSNLIEIKEGNFEDEIQSVSTVEEAKEFPLLDVQTAQKLGNRSLSEIDKVSQFEVNEEYNLISYEDKQYRLSPLEYTSIFKAMNNESIPGYVLVNQATEESHLVQLDNEIRYAPSDIFSQDLKRHLRGKYPSYIFDKFQFDIDDNGEAYYIAPVLKPTIGFFGGKIVQSFVIVNANTGECEEYLPEDLPKTGSTQYGVIISVLAVLGCSYIVLKNSKKHD